MTESKQAYYMILGVVSELPPELKAKYDAAMTELQEWQARHGDVAIMAIAVVAGQIAASESDDA